jgi:tetratricopeptide (TPR) repeat protein
MRILLIFVLAVMSSLLAAQPNCNAYKYSGDELKYTACKAAEKRGGHYQFSRAYQEALDEALAIDSTFAYAYRVKSTAYLKSGDFITWKKLMDKAVKYDPEGELFYRASCRYQFFRDYAGAIKDIELLDSLIDYDIGYSQNGDYHLNIIKALSYKAIGKPDESLQIFERQLSDSTHNVGIYDYLHLGVLYLEMGKFTLALRALKQQALENDIAENRYYTALVHKALGDEKRYLENIKLAKEKYENGVKMFDPYVEKMDQIFLIDIIDAMKTEGF